MVTILDTCIRAAGDATQRAGDSSHKPDVTFC